MEHSLNARPGIDLVAELSALKQALSQVQGDVRHLRFMTATAEAAIGRLCRGLELLEDQVAAPVSGIEAPTTPTAPWKEDETDFEGENITDNGS
ncbi:hypothetical protein FALBO_4869 [Fusarium albosuccineum]|uniref:Uncharacterized protein n=1 Tax=Fusarium albosuccineum TaxID=1237068 RepID=A0A8H4LEM4_9HYPO|nr:hypothetical protein FALBO_4869 [Fusarium albosuccineum]